MTVGRGQLIINRTINGPLKTWCKPFCVFFTTFTVVMFLLVMSVDLRRHRYLPLDAVIWEFEGSPQNSSSLINVIRDSYIQPPADEMNNSTKAYPSKFLLESFENRQWGVSIECGAPSSYSNADWFVSEMGWRNLKIQPNPLIMEQIRSQGSSASTSHSCLSVDTVATHTHIQTSTNYPNGTLTAVPCFPLYSMMSAFNATNLDLLTLHNVKLPLNVLLTLPTSSVKVYSILFEARSLRSADDSHDICCSDKIVELMKKWGYSNKLSCPAKDGRCYYVCTELTCPRAGY